MGGRGDGTVSDDRGGGTYYVREEKAGDRRAKANNMGTHFLPCKFG